LNLEIIHHWAIQTPQNKTQNNTKVNLATISNMYRKLCYIAIKDLDKANIKLGGRGRIVEIDERKKNSSFI
jgi:hypothetical protein